MHICKCKQSAHNCKAIRSNKTALPTIWSRNELFTGVQLNLGKDRVLLHK